MLFECGHFWSPILQTSGSAVFSPHPSPCTPDSPSLVSPPSPQPRVLPCVIGLSPADCHPLCRRCVANLRDTGSVCLQCHNHRHLLLGDRCVPGCPPGAYADSGACRSEYSDRCLASSLRSLGFCPWISSGSWY